MQSLWQEAQLALPTWPGFKRLHLTNEQEQAALECEQQAVQFFEALAQTADLVEVEKDGDGLERWTATYNLKGNAPKNR